MFDEEYLHQLWIPTFGINMVRSKTNGNGKGRMEYEPFLLFNFYPKSTNLNPMPLTVSRNSPSIKSESFFLRFLM